MTIRDVGKPVPSQLYLMKLAGLVVEGRAKVRKPSAAQVSQTKAQGYEMLRRMTGEDFGYDVECWYKHLIVGDYGLTHPYGYGALRRFLKQAGFEAPTKKDVLALLHAGQSHTLKPAAGPVSKGKPSPPAR